MYKTQPTLAFFSTLSYTDYMSVKHLLMLACLLLASLLLHSPLSSTLAVDNPIDSTAPITATVPDVTPPTPPVLIAPNNGSLVNTNLPTFIFIPATDSDSDLDYYQITIDNQLFYSSSIPALTTTQNSNLTTIIDPDLFTLVFTADRYRLADGSHTWYITGYDTAGNSVNSATWTFIVDTTPPLITLYQLAEYEGLNITTTDPSPTQPFATSTPTIILSGSSESNTHIIISLTQTDCPTNCQTYQFQTITDNTGLFSLTTDPLPYATYSITIQAIDPATNSSQLSPFTLVIAPPGSPLVSTPLAPALPPINTITDLLDELKTHPTIKQLNRLVAIPTALTISILLLINLLISLGLGIKYLPSLIWYYLTQLFILLGLRRRRAYWGVIYNSTTKRPIPLAMINCLQAQFDPTTINLQASSEGIQPKRTPWKRPNDLFPGGLDPKTSSLAASTNTPQTQIKPANSTHSPYDPLVETVFTDQQGRFELPLNPGRYYLTVIKSNYTFPDTELTSQTDPPYINLYHGEDILLLAKPNNPPQNSPAKYSSAKTSPEGIQPKRTPGKRPHGLFPGGLETKLSSECVSSLSADEVEGDQPLRLDLLRGGHFKPPLNPNPIFVFYLPTSPKSGAPNRPSSTPSPSNTSIKLSIPLTPTKPGWHTQLGHFHHQLKTFLSLANTHLYALGLILTVWLFFTRPPQPIVFALIFYYSCLSLIRKSISNQT